MHPQAALTEFLNELQSLDRKPSTLRFYRSLLNGFISFLATRGIDDTPAIDRSAIRAFFANLSTLELSTSTRAAYDRTIRTFLKFCLAEGWLETNPMAGRPRLKALRSRPDTLTLDEIRALLDTCDDTPISVRDRAIMLMLLDTGLRASELCDLVPDRVRVDGDRGLVYVPAGESKGVNDRSIPIWTETVRTLNTWLDLRPEADTVFTAFSGRRTPTEHRLTPSGLNQMIRRRCHTAEITGKKRLCHIWRHTFASRYILGSNGHGGDLESLRLLLGHSSLDTVRIHLTFQVHDLSEKHFALSPVRQLYE